MSDKNPLLGLRDKIDALDLQIMQAISDRAKCAQQVAEVKKGHNLEVHTDCWHEVVMEYIILVN